MACRRPSQWLKSPTTLTRWAFRRPDGEAGARHAVNHAQLGAELLVNAVFVALAEEIQIRLAQRGQKGIRIAPLRSRAVVPGDDDVVGINRVGLGGDPFKKPGGVDFSVGWTGGIFRGPARCRPVWPRGKNPRDDAGAVGQHMHAQKFMRRTMRISTRLSASSLVRIMRNNLACRNVMRALPKS